MKILNQPIRPIVNIALWVLTVFLTYTFALSCYHMLNGDDNKIVEMFNEFGGQTLRYTVAALEGLAAILILFPRTVILGSSLGVIAMIGVLAADMSSLGGIPAQPVLMLVLSLVLLVGRQNFPTANPLSKNIE